MLKLWICALLVVFVAALSWGTNGAQAHGVQGADIATATAPIGSDYMVADGNRSGEHGQHGKKGGMNGGHCSFACMAMLDKVVTDTTVALRGECFDVIVIEANAVATEPPRRPPKHTRL